MDRTENYGLPLPLKGEGYSIAIVNEVTTKTDTQMKVNADAAAKNAEALESKVEKISGKGLSTNDYTTSEKSKLAGLSNYDDTAIREAVAGKTNKTVPATAGNLASLDAGGNLVDSGKSPASFAAASHTHTRANITDFAHASTHATGGSDALSPSDIGASTSFKATGTLTTSGWAGTAAPYTQDLAVAGLLESDRPRVDPVLGTDDAARALIKTAWQVAATSSKPPYAYDGKITFYAASKPTTNIPVVVTAWKKLWRRTAASRYAQTLQAF